ncbi:hypothetical protein ACFY15_16065 [Streptomyces sp. NPDC001373]|uniref:hypothetical protein n=1 Tax=Streptomyces sp. NPDC001373 TaxID=3364565 RepID=UPI0036A23DCB
MLGSDRRSGIRSAMAGGSVLAGPRTATPGRRQADGRAECHVAGAVGAASHALDGGHGGRDRRAGSLQPPTADAQ